MRYHHHYTSRPFPFYCFLLYPADILETREVTSNRQTILNNENEFNGCRMLLLLLFSMVCINAVHWSSNLCTFHTRRIRYSLFGNSIRFVRPLPLTSIMFYNSAISHVLVSVKNSVGKTDVLCTNVINNNRHMWMFVLQVHEPNFKMKKRIIVLHFE